MAERGFLHSLITRLLDWWFSRPTAAEKQARRNEEAAREMRSIERETENLSDADRRKRARRWVRPAGRDDGTDSGG